MKQVVKEVFKICRLEQSGNRLFVNGIDFIPFESNPLLKEYPTSTDAINDLSRCPDGQYQIEKVFVVKYEIDTVKDIKERLQAEKEEKIRTIVLQFLKRILNIKR